MPGTVETIVGRFDRYPPLYYQMRLDRVTKELAADRDPPSMRTLDRLDDAAVACDRLHDDDKAIEWMAKKATALDAMRATKQETGEHQYRYLANLGTFHVHRWLRAGADRTRMDDVKRSEELIAKAIELNPNAHFGRERYQLLAIRALLDPPKTQVFGHPSILDAIPDFPAKVSVERTKDLLAAVNHQDAVKGLCGLITLGDAWQSIDIFTALGDALSCQEDNSVALLAQLRVQELAAAGKVSIFAPQTSALPDEDESPLRVFSLEVYSSNVPEVKEFYAAARAEADAWSKARETYITERLAAGRHPDTDPDFWSQWKEPSQMPSLPNIDRFRRMQLISSIVSVVLILLVVVLPSFLIVRGIVRSIRRRRARLRSAKPQS